tara:strand:+ start:2589 stop:4421 length:1833 start_codon:yes stop_codon:yes gene_type:complete
MQYESCGPYLLLEKLAAGGMAEVYLAKASGAEGVSKYIAVKRILPQYSSNSDFVDMFKTEARIAINISHVNIVPIYEFGEVDSQLYIAMEFVLGKNLRQLISKIKKSDKIIPLEHIVFIINEVAKGLDYAHRFIDSNTGKPLNIIHRDMSPQNVMLSYEGEVKIVDFGIAKAESKLEATQAGTLKGKYGYMSPEQVEGLELDYRTDIFSLGTILWELLAADRLFIANNEINTIKKIKACEVPSLSRINPEVDEELERITNKALTKDRSLRYQSSSDLHRDLNRYLNQHYPDYTSSDFANFMKHLYLKEIMDMREKLVQYSKVEVPRNSSKSAEVTRTVTQTASDLATAIIQKPDTNTSSINFKEKITLDNRKTTNTQRRATLSTRSNTQSGIHHTKTQIKPKSNRFLMVASMFILAVSTYLYMDPEAQQTLKANLGMQMDHFLTGSTDRMPQKEPTPQALPTPQAEVVNFHVKSKPSGAKIYINEKDTGFYTPGRIPIFKDQNFELTLRKRGYLDYHKELKATGQGKQFVATLQKSNVGYISIYVPTPNVEIYINNIKISEKPPIEKYAIQASERVVIRAINPYTKAEDRVVVSVNEDTHQRINLFPKKK